MEKNTIEKLKKKIQTFPDEPGIYQFFDTKKELIYVGKATSLKNRVKSYFIGKRTSRPIEQMIHQVASITYKQTDSVIEAIILESNYIKKYKPKYNVISKDDKSWNYLVITKDEYPLVIPIRQHELKQKIEQEIKKEFQYVFGPYPGLAQKPTMKVLTKLFNLSTCQKNKKAKKQKKPCLYRQMGQCLGVCTGEITSAVYKQKVIKPLVTFLRGGKKRLLTSIKKNMQQAAKEKQFEEAARLRDQLHNLQKIQDVTLINKSFFETEETNTQEFITKIEGYDISNLGTTGKVGSMVVFVHGEPDKTQYRKFKIKTVEGQSDVDCLDEVLTRRLKHNEWKYPDLFLIDGGLPQVNRIKKVFKKTGIQIPIIGIAKGSDRKKNEIILGTTDREIIKWVYKHTKILIRVRDEAHRFAIKFQREQRKLKA
ncbi:MAG: GIY-YIG nuclease family protein [Candidatus Magasanikbacteria bacterium]|nr:GIY-YIG nuclease family protein [Candidatus Magasanikbacteria bacterium]NCS72136.1 GIY-YIG nuclease family protein [Candidatus Magasanikbacteria bacterium]